MGRRVHAGVLLCTAALMAAACGGSDQPSGEAQTGSQAEAPQPLPGDSTITGRITYSGTAPEPRVVRMTADPLCMPEGGAARSQILLVGQNNELQNVFLYVKDGLGNRTFPAPKTPVLLDQKGCVYTPHVFGVQVGQPINISNSDPAVPVPARA